MRYDVKFYAKHNIKVTSDAVMKVPVAPEERALEKKYLHVLERRHLITNETIQQLEKDIERFPNNPKLQNYLANFYRIIENNVMFERVLMATVRDFPDYIFGKATLATYHEGNGDWEKLDELLGKERDIRIFEPYEYIHESLLFTYYNCCIEYELEFNNFDNAQKYHRILFDYEPTSKDTLEIAEKIEVAKLLHKFSSLSRINREIEYEPYFADHLMPTDEATTFYHPEINQLYDISYTEMPVALIDEIMALPRQTLIEDLEMLLIDGIKRSDYLEDENDASIHALYFLGALKSYESLDFVLDVMRQDEEYSDFHFGDLKGRFLSPTLYYLGENQLDKLLAFAKEPNRNIHFTFQLSEVVSQIALHQPDCRAEVLAFFKDLLTFFIKNVDDDNYIDSASIGFMVGHLVDMRAVELLDEIKLTFELKIIDDNINGNFDEVCKEITRPYHDSELNPLPLNIYEFYDCTYEKRKAAIPAYKMETFDAILNPTDPYEKFMQKTAKKILNKTMSNVTRNIDDYDYYSPFSRPSQTPTAPIKRAAPKVGRNEKCPCGSDKKYKHCCGK